MGFEVILALKIIKKSLNGLIFEIRIGVTEMIINVRLRKSRKIRLLNECQQKGIYKSGQEMWLS